MSESVETVTRAEKVEAFSSCSVYKTMEMSNASRIVFDGAFPLTMFKKFAA
jgi:hypothetical protein